MYFSYTQEELRSICKSSIEAFELWARRIIHKKLKMEYSENYFDVDIGNGEKVLNKEHYKKYCRIISSSHDRCNRPVDALFIESLIYILCKERLYKTLFKEILDYSYPQGVEEVREFLGRLIIPRNNLSHANPISIRQAEQVVCYTNDFIDGIKKYYTHIGKDKMWNTPFIIKVTDSLGKEYYPDENKTFFEVFQVNNAFSIGDTYKVWVEIDSSFNEDDYCIEWEFPDSVAILNSSHECCITFSVADVSANKTLRCRVIQNKEWHKHNLFEHEIVFSFCVLPKIK